MKNKTFSIPFIDDERMKYAKEYLTLNNYDIVEIAMADVIILPIPVRDEHFSVLDRCKPSAKIFFGFSDRPGYDYNKNEAFLLNNAFYTAEGAIALLKENTKQSLYNSNALIVGYGRIGKSLQRLLNAYGANVTVCARSDKSRKEIEYYNADYISINNLSAVSNIDFVFNTVPSIVFDKKEIEALGSDTLYIELASFPGGIDKMSAQAYGVKIIDGKQLPLRYSPKSAGYLIAKTVINMIEEGIK